MPLRIVIVAGEVSGDILGAGLITELRQRFPDIVIEGISGPQMDAAGCRSWGSYEQLAVMGLVEVLRHVPRILKLKRQLEKRILADPPDLFIGIDAPDFNLRLEKSLRRAGVRTVHYVCPSVWAWRASRVKTLKAACDRILCLLPFEKQFLDEHAIDGVFVGHPLADEIKPEADRQAGRRALGLPQSSVVAVLPGSRMGEVKYLGPAFTAAMQWLLQHQPDQHFVIPAARPAIRASMQAMVAAAGIEAAVTIVDGRARDAMRAADVVLLASGTATLETMLVGRPMVVSYKVSGLTAWLLRNSGLVNIERFSLPNLLAGDEVVAEILQEEATGENLGAAVLELLQDPGRRSTMETEFVRLAGSLRCNASVMAAAAVAESLGVTDSGG